MAALLLSFCTLPGLAIAAAPTVVDLHSGICTVLMPGGASDVAVRDANYRCGPTKPTRSKAWIWVRLDASRLTRLPAQWTLLVDQTRFDRIAVLVEDEHELHRTSRTATELDDNWAPGGLMRFLITERGTDIHGLYLGFENIDDLSLMRKIVASTAPAQARNDARWLLLMGMFAGTLFFALIYNLVIFTNRRPAFQRWYLAWVTVAFAYGMIWSNIAALLVPGLVGPAAVRLDFVLVGLMVAAGNMFFFAVIEDDILPAGLMRIG
jgi:uncharacterized membrane protein